MTYGEDGKYDAAYTYGIERIEVEALDETRPEAQDPLHYLYDGLGSVTFMVKPDGNKRDHYRYDEYGKPAPGNSKLSSDGVNVNHNSFGYTGEMWDEESELLYLRARYYEPKTGRFLSRDSYEGEINNPLSRHLYAYVGNNPVNRTDPSGNRYLDHDIDIGDHGFNQDLKTLLNVRPDVAERSFSYNETWYLQWSLNNQGYRDYDDRKLIVDGRYKDRTSSAHFKWWYANNAHFQETSKSKLSAAPNSGKPVPLHGSDDSLWGMYCHSVRDGKGEKALKYGLPPAVFLGNAVLVVGLGEALGPAVATQADKLRVIGHYPQYVVKAEELGARYFNIPIDVWNKMTPAEQWAANTRFLDRAIAKGADFIMATPLDKVRPDSYLAREIQYLISKGYQFTVDGSRLYKP